MTQIIAEKYALQSLPEEEPSRLSFCDLPTAQNDPGFPNGPNQSPTTLPAQPDPFFEFFVSLPNPAPQPTQNDIVFFGKTVHEKKSDQLKEHQKRDLFSIARSQSFRRQSFSDNRRADGFSGEIRSRCATADPNYHGQRVNITSLTSMSAKSRRRMFMFGPVKFKPEMELREIKQRQAKLVPSEKIPPIGGGKSQWGVIKSSLRGRSPLTSVLPRLLGCIPVPGRGVGSLVGGMTN